MFCPNCHTHILDDSTMFCGRCGEELTKKKKKSSFSSSFSSISSASTFKYMSKYGKKSNGDKYNHENLRNEEALERVLEDTPSECNINQQANSNNHNDQFNYNLKYSGVTKKRQTHDEQFNYSKNYSGVTKKGKTHDEQYNYSQRYSGVQPTAAQQQAAYQQQQQRAYQQRLAAYQQQQAAYHQKQSAYYQQQAAYQQVQPVTSDDAYRLAFIGTNKESIIKVPFSIPTLIFGPLYFMYRKMIALGIALIAITFIFKIYIDPEIASTFSFFLNLILAIKFRDIYLNYVNNKVKQIRENNPNKTSTELLEECSKQGSTLSIKHIVIIVIIYIFLSEIALAIYDIEQKAVVDNDNENVITEKDTNNNTNNNLDEFTISNYSFTVPVDLTVVKSYNNSKEYEYKPNAYDDSLCKIQINAEPSSSSARNYILYNQNKYTGYNKSGITYKETYSHQWFYQTYYTPGSQDYIKEYAMKDYGTEEIYSITTLSYSTNECELVTESIIKNFKKKN